MAAVASTTSSNSGTLPPTSPVLPPCARQTTSVAWRMQQEAPKPKLCYCTNIIQPHATVCKAVVQPVQEPTQVNVQYVELHMMIAICSVAHNGICYCAILPVVQLQAVAHCNVSKFGTLAPWSGVSGLVDSCLRTCPSSPCVTGRILLVQLGQLSDLLLCAVVHSLVKRLQGVWVSNDASVTQDVSEVRDIAICDLSIIVVPRYSRSSLCSSCKVVKYCSEAC